MMQACFFILHRKKFTLNMKGFLIIFLLFSSIVSMAREGTIMGTIIDDQTGETLVGVTILVKGVNTGTASDPEGQFSLEVSPGIYELQISYISYQTLNINGVRVEPGEITFLDELRLKESTLEIDEVVVTADLIRNTETALNTI